MENDQTVGTTHESPMPSETHLKSHPAGSNKFVVSKNLIIVILLGTFIFLVLMNLLLFFFPRNIFTRALDATLTFSLPRISLNQKSTVPSPDIATPSDTPDVSPSLSPMPSISVTPSVSPTPRPPVASDKTHGVLERASCEGISGWAYDPEKNEESMHVWLYADGGLYGGSFSGKEKADDPRTDINNELKISGDHGFRFSVIPALKDGKEHSLYVYLEAKDGVRHQLGNTPLYITCP